MELTFRSVAKESSISGRQFEDGMRIACFLVRKEDGELERLDVLEDEAAEAIREGASLVCRWSRVFKVRVDEEADARRQAAETAESMFLSMAREVGLEEEMTEDGEERSREDRVVLLHILTLMLERRRILKSVRGSTHRFRHVVSGKEFEVEDVHLRPEQLLAAVTELEAVL